MVCAPHVIAAPSSVEALRMALARGFSQAKLVLPVLPEVAGRVIALSNDPNTEIDDLAAVINRDQTLAATVLGHANSAAYAAGEKITSLHQAMMRLGTTVVSGIAIAACLDGEAFRSPGHDAYRRRVLTHALLSGRIARELAWRLRRNPDTVFMCALLHTIGKPVVLRLIADLQRVSRVQIPEQEVVELVDAFEGPAAEAATMAWNLPRHVQVSAAHYCDPDAAPSFVVETRITALAGRLASWVMEGQPLDEHAIRSLPDWEMLAVLPDEIDDVIRVGHELRQSGRTGI
jgi:HD-like signal output (HDOD) protein